MLFPVENLVKGRGKPLCIQAHETVRAAQVKMLEHDYSQLPVTDDEGYLMGLISEQSVTRMLYHLDEEESILDLPVSHCIDRSATLPLEADVFRALDYLQANYAVVIVEDRKPVGIITHYDTTHFFRDLSGDLLIIQDIEVTLRRYIESVFSNDHQMTAALMRAFGMDKKEPNQPRYLYNELSFAQHVQLIVTEANWPNFEAVLRPKSYFSRIMNQVGAVRNQLAHFRGSADPIAQDVLRRARSWLESRPRPKGVQRTPRILKAPRKAVAGTRTITTGKYAPLERWLREQHHQDQFEVSFEDITNLLSDSLPPSAYEHQAWWANDTSSSGRHSLAWLYGGWKVADVDLNIQTVRFTYSPETVCALFFSELIERVVQTVPELSGPTIGRPRNTPYLKSVTDRVYYGWWFSNDDELHLHTSCAVIVGEEMERDEDPLNPIQANRGLIWEPFGEDIAERLQDNHEAIEQEFGAPLEWRSSEGHVLREGIQSAEADVISGEPTIKVIRVDELYTRIDAPISHSADEYTTALNWATRTISQLVATVEPYLKEFAHE